MLRLRRVLRHWRNGDVVLLALRVLVDVLLSLWVLVEVLLTLRILVLVVVRSVVGHLSIVVVLVTVTSKSE